MTNAAEKQLIEVLSVVGGGELASRAADLLTEAGMAVAETGKAGYVSIKINIRPNGQGSVLMDGDATAKIPKRKIIDSLFFVTTGGQFLRNDPAQEQLPLRDPTTLGDNIHSMKA